MPTITLEMAPMNMEQKRKIAEEFTESAARITGIDKESFYVFIKENNLENVAVGGKLLGDKAREAKS